MTEKPQAQHLSFFAILKLLKQHRRLAERRHPMYSANKVARWTFRILAGLTFIYLLGFGIGFGLMANDAQSSVTAAEYICMLMPFFVILDFMLRFVAQQTPSQLVKPYVLLPIPRYACIDSFVISSILSAGNLVWFVMLVPFCLISVVFAYGVLTALSLMLFFYLVILANSQWYAICRTLIIGNLLWWLLPIAVFGGLFGVWAFVATETTFDIYASLGRTIGKGSILPHLGALALLGVLAMINRRLQYAAVWRELGRERITKVQGNFRLAGLNRFGETGIYLKLEIISLLRNKNPRKSFYFSTFVVLLMSLIISFSTTYDSRFMTNFWGFYNFVVYGAMMLTRVMSYEANYIDALMVRKENILKLLTAKYYFFCALLVLPFALMLPMVFVGKWQLLMLLSYGIFTAGFQYCMLMQLAVYNKQKLPLNEKFLSKAGIDNNYVQSLISWGTFVIPMVIISILEAVFSETTAWLVMMVIGVAFIATHRFWLTNIYQRMMKRKYQHLMDYHA